VVIEMTTDGLLSFVYRLPWGLIVVLCLTLGLAPFRPPHIVEKLQMFFQNELRRSIDWLDLFLHGAPWALLLAKVVVSLVGRRGS
jgi:hypothetical protein